MIRKFDDVGDDEIDVTDKLRTFLAGGGACELGSGTYLISDQIMLPDGLVLDGGGATIRIKSDSKRAGLLARGGRVEVRNLSFDSRDAKYQDQDAALYLIDATGRVEHCSFNGHVRGAGCHVYADTRDIEGFAFIGNTVECSGDLERQEHAGLWLQGKMQGSAHDVWMSEHRGATFEHVIRGAVVSGNKFTGGYYAISLDGVLASEISANECVQNVRGISVQNSSSYNRITLNEIRLNKSAGVHVAYASCFNQVVCNAVSSDVAEGEGFIQAYVGSKGNVFLNNVLVGTSPKYFMYCGIESDGCAFLGNRVKGHALRAVVAIEGEWDKTQTDARHRGARQEVQKFASKGMGDVVVSGTSVTLTADCPVFYVSGYGKAATATFVGNSRYRIETAGEGVAKTV